MELALNPHGLDHCFSCKRGRGVYTLTKNTSNLVHVTRVPQDICSSLSISSIPLIVMDSTMRRGELTGKTFESLYAEWLLLDLLSLKTRLQFGFDNAGETYEQHEVYLAMLTSLNLEVAERTVQQPLAVGMDGIVKVKKQYVFLS